MKIRKLGYLLLIIILLTGCGPKKSEEVKALDKKILNLGEITLESLEMVEELESLYAALSEEDKAVFEYHDKIIEVRETYNQLLLDSKLAELKYGAIKWNSDVPLSEIKEIKYSSFWGLQPNMFITKSNELYEFSTDKIYSNGYMTKKAETDLKFDSFYIDADDRENSLLVSTDGTLYEYEYNNPITNIENHVYIKNYIKTIKQVSKEHPYNYCEYVGGVNDLDACYYIENNQIYELMVKKINLATGIIGYEKFSERILDTIPNGEKFISLDGKVIKTDKAFYKIGIKNQKEVDQYADVEPIYGLVRIDNISDLYEYVEYYNGSHLILKNDSEYLY